MIFTTAAFAALKLLSSILLLLQFGIFTTAAFAALKLNFFPLNPLTILDFHNCCIRGIETCAKVAPATSDIIMIFTTAAFAALKRFSAVAKISSGRPIFTTAAFAALKLIPSKDRLSLIVIFTTAAFAAFYRV